MSANAAMAKSTERFDTATEQQTRWALSICSVVSASAVQMRVDMENSSATRHALAAEEGQQFLCWKKRRPFQYFEVWATRQDLPG
jgi:hypothetical protein